MWFTENPWPPIIILAVTGVILSMLGTSRQKRGLYVAALVCFVLCGAVWYIDQAVVTDAELIEAHIDDLADAYHRNDMPRWMSYFDNNDEQLMAMAISAIGYVDIDADYRITDRWVSVMAEGSMAQSHFRANVTAHGMGISQRLPTRWRVTWQKIGDDWKIVEVTRLELIGDQEMPIFERRE